MADAMETLKGILGDGAEDAIKSVVGSLSGGGAQGADGGADMKKAVETITAGKNNDPRTNLLLSLRPYMRETRRHSIDSAIRLLNFTKLSGMWNEHS